jgi:hypothetical protein
MGRLGFESRDLWSGNRAWRRSQDVARHARGWLTGRTDGVRARVRSEAPGVEDGPDSGVRGAVRPSAREMRLDGGTRAAVRDGERARKGW